MRTLQLPARLFLFAHLLANHALFLGLALLCLGAGEAATGLCDLFVAALGREGVPADEARALVGMLGVLPVAIQQSRTCVDETRGGQLARMVYATLQSEPYDAAQCFGSDEDAKLDLSTYDTQTDETKVVKLYASYAVTGAVNVIRATDPPLGSEYQLTLSFEKVMPDTTATPPPTPPATDRKSVV